MNYSGLIKRLTYPGDRNQLGQSTGVIGSYPAQGFQTGTRNQLGQPTGGGTIYSPGSMATGLGGSPIRPGTFSKLGQAIAGAVGRVGGTLQVGGRSVPMVKTQDQPDPFQALTEAQIQERAKSMIDSLIDPRMAAIEAAYKRRSEAGTAAIKGISEALMSHLGDYQGRARDIYSRAEQGAAATEAGLAGFLSGTGGSEASALAGRLAGINAPDVTGAAAAAVQQAGTGAAGASYGKGSATIQDLISRGAAAEEYGAKMPVIGSLMGQQQIGQFQGKLTEDEKTALDALTSQVPGLITSTVSDLRTNEREKARIAEQRRQFGVTQSNAIERARLSAAASKYGADERERVAAATLLQRDAASQRAAQNKIDVANIQAKGRKTRVQTAKAGDGSLMVYDPKKGWTKIPGTAKPGGSGTSTETKVARDGTGQLFQWNPQTKRYDIPIGGPKPTVVNATQAKQALGNLAAAPGNIDWRKHTISQSLANAYRQSIIDGGGPDPGPLSTNLTQDQFDAFVKQLGVKPPAGTTGADKQKQKADKAKAEAKAEAAKAAALKSASAIATKMIQRGHEIVPIYGMRDVPNPITQIKERKRVPIGQHVRSKYYPTYEMTRAAVESQLSPYMSQDEITKFVQQILNATYNQPGMFGRPRSLAQLEAAEGKARRGQPVPPPTAPAPAQPTRPATGTVVAPWTQAFAPTGSTTAPAREPAATQPQSLADKLVQQGKSLPFAQRQQFIQDHQAELARLDPYTRSKVIRSIGLLG